MPENILVIEYEPRYTEKIRNALAGRPFEVAFAHDGQEALRAFDAQRPSLIVISSMVPKANIADLIHAIRQRAHLQRTPILLTVSGYTGSTPKHDAVRFGASDLLPKPYTEADLLQKIEEILIGERKLTSEQIFGDLLEEKAPAGARKPMSPKDDLDKLLADTLSGVMAQKKKGAPAAVKPKTQPGSAELDKLLSDLTLTSRPKTTSGTVAVPRPAAAVPAPTVDYDDNVALSVPVIPKAAAAPVPVEEPEPTDGTRFGQYVLLEKIATGGMAEVWKARMRGVEGFQKIVAIKKILPHLSDNQDFIEMFVDEAKLAAQLNHSNIIHIYDLGKIQNSYYIAMEYVDGCDLKTILKQAQERDQPLTIELALFITSKIAAALDYAHRKRDFENKDLGLVHRDISPPNVLISKEGDIKLCDFGIAKAASKASHTQAGALKGKLQYMSPEQAWGKAIDNRSDIFALATVLFEMLTRRQLFTGENEISILEQVREARVDPPSKYNDEVTPQIDAIVRKALQKGPADRYQTAAEMARDLDAVLYEMRPTPTSADLAIYMHRLETAPVMVAPPPAPVVPPPTPAPIRPAVAEAVAHTPPGVMMPSWEAARMQKKKSMAIPISIAAVLAIAAGGGYVFLRGRTPAPAPAKTASTPPQVVAPTATQPSVGAGAPAGPAAGEAPAATQAQTTAPTTSTQPVVDPAKVDAEVQKRLAAERAKLEQEMRAKQPAPQPAPILTRRAVEPQPVVQQPAAPQPAVAENRPAPQPQPTQTVSTQPPPAPAPQPVAEEPKAKLGDLVASGSEDVAARMTRRADVPYPPRAKVEHVEGTVIITALISETGKVLDVKVIRPIDRPVGLNEAAQEIVRRSTFSPPVKDGVRVKAWTTVSVGFKLVSR